MFGPQKKNRRKQTESRWRLPAINWRALAMSVGSVAAVCAVAAAVTWTLDQPIESVSVAGRFQRVAPIDVERVVKQRVRGAGLLSVNLDAVRQAIHTLPWVDAVSVQRAWPRGLHVLVIEQVAAARWGENGLLNTRGELFSKDEHHMPTELAELSGPDGKESVVAQHASPLECVTLECDGPPITLKMREGHACFDATTGATESERVVPTGDMSLGSLIGEELGVRTRDLAFERALVAAREIRL